MSFLKSLMDMLNTKPESDLSEYFRVEYAKEYEIMRKNGVPMNEHLIRGVLKENNENIKKSI